MSGQRRAVEQIHSSRRHRRCSNIIGMGQYIDRAIHQLPVLKSGLEQLLLFNYQEDLPKDSSKFPSIHITQFVETPVISYFNLIQACQNLVSIMRSIFKDQDFINAIV